MNAISFLSLMALCIPLVFIGGCSECTTCMVAGTPPVPTVTPNATPTIEILELNGFTIFRDPVGKTARIANPAPLDLPSGPLADDPHAYDTELALAASQLQQSFFSENATDLLDGYTVTRLKAPVTNAGQPLAEILSTGSGPSDIVIARF